jgi:hypothetical protein
MYNLLDANETVIESNLSEEAAAILMEHTNGDGFTYFYYPIEAEQLSALKEEKGESIRFIKRVPVNQ